MQLRSVSFGVSLGLLLALAASLSVAVAAGPSAPPAVRRAVTAIFGAEKVAIEHEQENGVDVYEVGAPTRLELVFDGKGQVTELEVKLPVGAVPPAVLAAARRSLPKGARVDEAELLVRGGQLFYEIEAQSGADEVELVLDPQGGVVSQEVEHDDDDDDDDA